MSPAPGEGSALPRDVWYFEGRIVRERETPPRPDEVQEVLTAVVGALSSPALLTDAALRRELAERIASLIDRM